MNELEPLIPYLKEISATLGKHVGKRLGDVLKHFGTDITKYPKRMIERKDAEATAKSESLIEMRQAATQHFKENPERYPEFIRQALVQGFGWTVEDVANFNKIVGDTTESLLNNPPQEDVNADQPTEDISKDWLNGFRGVACKKSSEDAQDLFSKVLEGEIRKPGSFSLRALTILSDMDQKVATLFNAFCSLCLVSLDDANEYLKSKSYFDISDARIPIIRDVINDIAVFNSINSSNFSQKEIAEKSKSMYKEYRFDVKEFQLLKEYRLIDDSLNMTYGHFWYNDHLWTFTDPSTDAPESSEDLQKILISGFGLTSVGKELYRIITFDPPPNYFEKITEFLQDFYSIKLYNMPKSTEDSPDRSADQNTTDT